MSNQQLAIEGLDPHLAADLSAGLAQVESLLSTHIEGDYPLVEETSRHLVLAGGKRLRPLLVLLTSHLGPERGANIFKAAVACMELTMIASTASLSGPLGTSEGTSYCSPSCGHESRK